MPASIGGVTRKLLLACEVRFPPVLQIFQLVFQELHNVFDIPNAIRHASSHRGSDSKPLVNANKVVVHKLRRDRRNVVLELL